MATTEYGDAIRLVERMHRLFLDVLRTEMRRKGVEDINPVQALLLMNIGADDLIISDIKDRGYYHGSNVSYNVKGLVESGYLAQERSARDKRAVKLSLTDKGREFVASMEEFETALETGYDAPGRNEALGQAVAAFGVLEDGWADYVKYARIRRRPGA